MFFQDNLHHIQICIYVFTKYGKNNSNIIYKIWINIFKIFIYIFSTVKNKKQKYYLNIIWIVYTSQSNFKTIVSILILNSLKKCFDGTSSNRT